jgi:hypothetical protein
MSCEKIVIARYRGADVLIDLPFTTDDDPPVAIPMTGWELSIRDAGPAGPVKDYVLDNATVAWVDQAGGIGRFSLPWQESSPSEFWFQVLSKRTADDLDDPLPPIWVRFK